MASTRGTTAMVLRPKRIRALKSLSLPLDSDCDDDFCEECGSRDSPAKLLLCNKCDKGYHLFCLRPILVSVLKGSWFCPSCSKDKKLKWLMDCSAKCWKHSMSIRKSSCGPK